MSKKAKQTEEPQDERFQMRASKSFMKAVDEWRRRQPDLPGRSEAIRRLLDSHPEIAEVIRDQTASALEAEAAKKGKRGK